ncbi:hypothetical protein CR513_55126, partial [Mucuna pruriens]
MKATLTLTITSRRLWLYFQRGHIKAQVLGDFIIELAPIGQGSSNGREWFLFVDRASNQKGSGVGIILEGLDESLCFEFKANNNQVEYEALLAGIKLVEELGAHILMAKSDSKLVIGQVNADYLARDPQLIKYWNKVMKQATLFEKFILLHVLCLDTEKAKYVIREVHKGMCRSHIGGRALASKVARAGGYY